MANDWESKICLTQKQNKHDAVLFQLAKVFSLITIIPEHTFTNGEISLDSTGIKAI